jgi:hypothetical protein
VESAAGGKALLRGHPIWRIWVYNNRSAYDELSDGIPLTEELDD